MLDTDQYVTHPRQFLNDPDGVMDDLEHWSPCVAGCRAASDGLTLAEKHWQLLDRLREQYRNCADHWTARQLTRTRQRGYADLGGCHHLFQLFPNGPIAQGCRLAGLPVPPDALDRPFGSAH